MQFELLLPGPKSARRSESSLERSRQKTRKWRNSMEERVIVSAVLGVGRMRTSPAVWAARRNTSMRIQNE
jgi:hypothetical protein